MPIFSPKSWSLAIKLSLTITVVITAVGFLIGAIILAQDWKRFHDLLGEKALLLAESVAISAPKAMLRKDYWSLYLNLKNMTASKPRTIAKNEIITAMVLDKDGKVQAHIQPANNPMGLVFSPRDEFERNLFEQAMNTRSPLVLGSGGFSKTGFQEAVMPLFLDQKYMGVVRVRLSIAQLYEQAKHSAIIALVVVFCFVIFGSVLGTLASRRMVKPLSEISRGLQAVGRGEMTDFRPIPIRERDEIGLLSVTYNQIMVELAEKKMLEEEMVMSEKLVALGRITAGVAHEVNNPLAGLLNCIDTLRKHPDNEKLVKRYLPVIDQGLHRIKEIVHNLLVGLKIEEQEEIIDIEHIDNLRDLISAEIGNRDINVVWNNSVAKSLNVSGKLEQVVCNLLKNALEILPEEGTITFEMSQRGNNLSIRVSDNGPGIPSSIKNQLFDPFFTTKSNGTGLGLWVVYRLTQNMNGIIEVESAEGQGATFHITVPLIHKEKPDDH